mgnify:FL=1
MQASPQFGRRGQTKIRLPGWEQNIVPWATRGERAYAVDPIANHQCEIPAKWSHAQETLEKKSDSIRLLSFNIQVGIKTSAYRQYFTKGWKHVLPHVNQVKNLKRIAKVVGEYDIVALQEVDGGSIRSGFVNQVEFLAKLAHFPYWYAQLNRDLGPLAQHGNGLLSRIEPMGLEDHKLPGAIPGRGAVIARLPYAGEELVVVMLHLSLGDRSRCRQLAYIAERISQERRVIVMGDMNTPATDLMDSSPLKNLDLTLPDASALTYPAWRPSHALDHILVSPHLEVNEYEVLGHRISDHLPIAIEVTTRAHAAVH